MIVMSGMRLRHRKHRLNGMAALRRAMTMITALLLALGHVAQG